MSRWVRKELLRELINRCLNVARNPSCHFVVVFTFASIAIESHLFLFYSLQNMAKEIINSQKLTDLT